MRKGVTIVVGGRWHTFDLARELEKRGWLHRIITNYPKFMVKKWGVPENKIVSLPASMLFAQAGRRVLGEKRMVRWQYQIHSLFARAAAANIGDPDLVHGLSGFSLPAMQACASRKIPFVLERLSSHMAEQTAILTEENERLGLSGQVTHAKVIEMELAEYELAARIIIPSHFVEKTFLGRGVRAEKLYLNALGVNRSAFTPGPKRDNKFRVIYAGSLTYRKGIHYLCEAFRLAALPNSELLLVGGNAQETELLIGRPAPEILRTGHLPQAELVEHYRQSSVFAIASVEEGLAMVQAQALSCGLPLICTTNTGGEDLLGLGGAARVESQTGIREYPAGYVVPIRDPRALADCLTRLYSDRQLLHKKSVATESILAQSIDWTAYADRAIALYESLGR